MHRHDQDLIMALAEGTLPDGDVAAAERSIASCAECREDLALNRMALDAMAAAPAPALNDIERARLRRELWEAVDHAPETVRTVAVAPRRFRPWMAATAVAAVFLAVVVAGPVLNNIGGGDDAGTASADFAATTTAPAADLDEQSLEAADGAEPETVASQGAATTAPEATIPGAADGDDTAAEAPAPTLLLRDVGEIDVSGESTQEEGLFNLQQLDELRRTSSFAWGVDVLVNLPPCYDEAVADLVEAGIEVEPIVVGIVLNSEVVVIRYVIDSEPIIEVLDYDTCETLLQLP